jgi:hypothetical protein
VLSLNDFALFCHLDQWMVLFYFWSSWFEKFPNFNEIDYAFGQVVIFLEISSHLVSCLFPSK